MGGKTLSLQQNIIYLSAQFSHGFSRRLEDEFKNNGITITTEQFSILVLLWYKEGINQNFVSHQLRRDKTTIARVLMNMKKNKLITQVTDPADKRAKLIYLTKKGAIIQSPTVKISGALYTKTLLGIPDAILNNGVKLFQKMIDNLELKKIIFKDK